MIRHLPARMLSLALALICFVLTAIGSRAADLHVDPALGNDEADGVTAPVRSLARAVALASPGDTVHLKPATYFETLNLASKSGLPGQPIIVDGHGAILDGSEPLNPQDWEGLGKGIFRAKGLLPNPAASVMSRWYFIWNGRMNRMGRMAKGASAPFKKPDDLQAGEWTYVEAEESFYLRLPEGQELEAANIRLPIRANGVSLARKGAHLTVRNLTATHFYNDGFNIHGHQIDIIFENITAFECGDDGFSAHETSECRIDGLVSINNSTGVCDIGSSITHFRNVFISGCLGHDVFFVGDTEHSLENALIESSAIAAITLGQGHLAEQTAPCKVRLKNVLVRREADKPGEVRVSTNCRLEADSCTFADLGITVQPSAEMVLSNTLFSDQPKPAGGGANAEDLEKLRPTLNVLPAGR